MQESSLYDCQGRKQEQGGALILAILVMLVMSIVIMGMATDSDLDVKISRNLQLKNQAFNNAETGIAFAAEVVRQSAMLQWMGENSSTTNINLSGDYRLKIIEPDSGLGSIYDEDAEIEVYYDENGNEDNIAKLKVKTLDEVGYLLESDGFEKNNAESIISALFLPFKPFSAGMIGCDQVKFNGKTYIAETDILSKGSIINTVNVTGDINEYQNFICDPLDVVNMVDDANPDPEWGMSDDKIVKDKAEILREDFSFYEFGNLKYKFGDLTIKKTFTIDQNLGEVVLYVEGDLDVDGEIVIEDNTQLTIYVKGKINITGNGKANKEGEPRDLIIYSSNSSEDTGVEIGGTSAFNGAIYAPLANIVFSGNPELTGAVRGKTVIDSGNVSFIYDPSLQDWVNSYPSGYYLSSWNSIQN